ncbi:MAG: lytic transglycosylase domain-containing protein, partial [Kiloniellales bacterium]|nr:lytic transglycosylase domain-containing protein [Kiloniellales bacterium]
PAAADQPQAATAPDTLETPTAVLPETLGPRDARLYREIFALQEGGNWTAADARIARLDDRALMGHVLFQRYMHPTAYRSKYKELKAWMADYADHPGADRIYRLAMKRRPGGAAKPKRPVKVKVRLLGEAGVTPYRSTKTLSKSQRRRARAIKRRVRSNVLRTRLTVTEKLLKGPEAQKLLDTVELDQAFGQVAAGWYYYGKPDKAYRLASAAAERSGPEAPLALWIAGLSAWRLGDISSAVGHFETLARSHRTAGRNRSAGAYWAARAHLRLRNPGKVSEWLLVAADFPRSFYGLLARRALGMEIPGPQPLRRLDRAQSQRLLADPAARRAIGLLQVGERERAESELARLDGDGDQVLAAALSALNDAAGFPAQAMRIARSLVPDADRWSGQSLDSALYPIPPWQPDRGFAIDRALIYALMRQESAFRTDAKSRDGARGLMQLLPSTANYVVRKRTFRGKARNRLFDPALNIDVGQRYIDYLLNHAGVGGDLLRMAAAYNAGPGNLAKWRRKLGPVDDPLLFIESLPSRETRDFVEKVVANLWIYRARLGQPLPTLDAVAAGDWPAYTPLDRLLQAAAKPTTQPASRGGTISNGVQ